MQNLENLDVFEILITQKLLKCPKDPFVRSALKCMLYISCHFRSLKPLTLRMDRAKLLEALTPLPVSHAIVPRAVCFATSHPANHSICSYIDLSGYVSGPIRRCLFIDYITYVLSHDIASWSDITHVC